MLCALHQFHLSSSCFVESDGREDITGSRQGMRSDLGQWQVPLPVSSHVSSIALGRGIARRITFLSGTHSEPGKNGLVKAEVK